MGMLRIFRRTTEWGVRNPGLFGKVEWLGEGKTGRQAAEDRRKRDRQVKVVQRRVQKRDKCSGGRCKDDGLCAKHSRTKDLSGPDFQLYDAQGRNLNTKRWDE